MNNGKMTLANAIDELIFRRMAQLTASDDNCRERKELAHSALMKLEQVILDYGITRNEK